MIDEVVVFFDERLVGLAGLKIPAFDPLLVPAGVTPSSWQQCLRLQIGQNINEPNFTSQNQTSSNVPKSALPFTLQP